MEMFQGNDGETSGEIVKVYPKGGQCKLMRRSIQHLYPLEGNNRVIEEQQETEETENIENEVQNVESHDCK